MNKLYIGENCVKSKAAMMVLNSAGIEYETVVVSDRETPSFIPVDDSLEPIEGYRIHRRENPLF